MGSQFVALVRPAKPERGPSLILQVTSLGSAPFLSGARLSVPWCASNRNPFTPQRATPPNFTNLSPSASDILGPL
jgi:hypothetical protein